MAVVINGTTGIDKVQDGSIQTADLAAGAVTVAKVSDQVATGGRRNLVINGAMQVAQRTTSATGVNSNGYHSVDRYQTLCRGGAEYTQSQSTDAPDGFGYSLKFECTTADASPAGTDRTFLQHLFEGQDVQAFGKGTSGHKSATVSFWVKSSETGDMQVNLVDDSNNAQIHSSVTINSANTWEYKTLTYSMDHSGYEIDNDNSRRFWIEWIISRGTDYTGGSAQTSWTLAPANNTRGAATTINAAASIGSTFLITGVQLEVGDTATPFEHRSYGEELNLCQRYFYIFPRTGGTLRWNVTYYNTNVYATDNLPSMRAVPTVTDIATGTSTASGFNLYALDGDSMNSSTNEGNAPTLGAQGLPENPVITVQWTGLSKPTGVSNQPGSCSYNGASPGLYCSAEL